ncbi:MAG: hypothetical protein QXH21_08950 [Ignisphaera sp.]
MLGYKKKNECPELCRKRIYYEQLIHNNNNNETERIEKCIRFCRSMCIE